MNIIQFFNSFARRVLPTFLYVKLRRSAKFFLDVVRRLGISHSNIANKVDNQLLFQTFGIIQNKFKPETISLVICCAFQGRHEILKKSILESFHTKYKDNVRWFLCGSNSHDQSFISELNQELDGKVNGMVWRNNPLGEKWQASVSFSKILYDAELLAITGSDDILSSKLIDTILDKHFAPNIENNDKPVAMYCTDEWSVASLSEVDEYSPTLIRCKLKRDSYYIPLGAGRFYTKSFLSELNDVLFDVNLNSCLDDYAYLKAKELEKNIVIYPKEYGLLLSVKGNWSQMNSIKTIIDSPSIDTIEYSISEYKILEECLSNDIFSALIRKKNSYEYTWSS